MDGTEIVEATRQAYDAMAYRYAEFVTDPATRSPLAESFIWAFADAVAALPGTAGCLDAGCGPGHWTAALRDRGLRTCGVDLSPVMIDIARHDHPDLHFTVGSVLDLAAADGEYSGVLSHFSLIHTPPELVPAAVGEFARVLTACGYLLLAFQSTDDDAVSSWVSYDHKVTPGYRWNADALASIATEVGFTETARLVLQPGPKERVPSTYLLMRKPPAAAEEDTTQADSHASASG